jgi:intracellular sulfur oxidation DsrE/DsrF family protein
MQDDADRSRRREFLGQLGIMAIIAGRPRSVLVPSARRREAGPSPWDMSWVDRITAAPYKAVLDSQNLDDGAALDYAADIMNTFREVYNGPDTQTRVVVVMRRLGVPMALKDELWDRSAIGEARKVNDPVTTAPAKRNPWLRAAPNAPSYEVDSKLESLMPRGLTVLVCNRAAMNMAHSFAEKYKLDVEKVREEVRNGLIPGALLMPNGIFAIVRAQNAGCAYLKY